MNTEEIKIRLQQIIADTKKEGIEKVVSRYASDSNFDNHLKEVGIKMDLEKGIEQLISEL